MNNLNMIVAVDKKWGIGNDNKLLTYIKNDLAFFKKQTLDQIIVMGYNTYMSLPKRPLPNRTTIVLTSKKIELDDSFVVHSIDDLSRLLNTINPKNEKKVFISGGASIYKQFLPYCDSLYITHIHHEFEADTFFPQVSEDNWHKELITGFDNSDDKYKFDFYLYKRK